MSRKRSRGVRRGSAPGSQPYPIWPLLAGLLIGIPTAMLAYAVSTIVAPGPEYQGIVFLGLLFGGCFPLTVFGGIYLRHHYRRYVTRWEVTHRVEVYRLHDESAGVERWAALCHGDGWSTTEASRDDALHAAWLHCPSATPKMLSTARSETDHVGRK